MHFYGAVARMLMAVRHPVIYTLQHEKTYKDDKNSEKCETYIFYMEIKHHSIEKDKFATIIFLKFRDILIIVLIELFSIGTTRFVACNIRSKCFI